MPQIEIKNLKVKYYNESTETLALDDVNVSFINEKVTAIVGPSGCGKTTLIKTICGFLGLVDLSAETITFSPWVFIPYTCTMT